MRWFLERMGGRLLNFPRPSGTLWKTGSSGRGRWGRTIILRGCQVYENLDDVELLRAALDAMNREHNADAVSLLKILIDRNPVHPYGHYLLAAEHMQLGMVDRAEEGFARAVALAPDFSIARFQLGQLYLVKGDGALAKSTLAPLADLPSGTALASYAKGLIAMVDDDVPGAVEALQTGLACEQEILPLAGDMQRLLANLMAPTEDGAFPAGVETTMSAAPLYLSAYGKTDP